MSIPVVLVVEDNDVIRRIATLSLRRLGLEVDQARTGEEAVNAVKRRRYHLILMDVLMPVMSGLDAAQAIRRIQEERGWRTPIVAVTASDTRSNCLAAGMDDHITKPADYQRIIQKWLPELKLEAS